MSKVAKVLLVCVAIIIFFAVAGLAGFIVLRKIILSNPTPPARVTSTGSSPATAGKYTLSELAEHNTPSDCYIAYQNDVFNITWFIPKHEGGTAITEQCGKVVDEFSKIHPGGPFTKRAIQVVLQASKIGTMVGP
jgi:predicted heme/steroid binding protein